MDFSHKGGQTQTPRLSLGGSKKSGADPLRARRSVQQDADRRRAGIVGIVGAVVVWLVVDRRPTLQPAAA